MLQRARVVTNIFTFSTKTIFIYFHNTLMILCRNNYRDYYETHTHTHRLLSNFALITLLNTPSPTIQHKREIEPTQTIQMENKHLYDGPSIVGEWDITNVAHKQGWRREKAWSYH